MAAKTRPVLVLSIAYGDVDRAIVTVVPHTTEFRGSPFEIGVAVPFLATRSLLGSSHLYISESVGNPKSSER